MADIKIKVEGRIATNLTPEVKLVTKNDGYTVEFEFDESWSVSSLKTALFIANGQKIPVPFTGSVCKIPMLVGVRLLHIGVQSNDVLGLQTTIGAKVECELSADDLSSEEIEPPTKSIYDQIVSMINEGMVKGEKGDKGDKGEKGDAGAIKFVTVVSLPTENIDESAIYLVPLESEDEQNRFTEYAYIDGKWETLGAISIQVDHSEYVKFTDYASGSKAGVVKTIGGAGSGIKVENGIITTYPASKAEINNMFYYPAITSLNIGYATKHALVYPEKYTSVSPDWTDEDKAAACETIGASLKKTWVWWFQCLENNTTGEKWHNVRFMYKSFVEPTEDNLYDDLYNAGRADIDKTAIVINAMLEDGDYTAPQIVGIYSEGDGGSFHAVFSDGISHPLVISEDEPDFYYYSTEF